MSGKSKGIFKKAAKQHGLHKVEFMKVLAISQFHSMTFLFNLFKYIWQQPPNSVVIYINSKHVKCLINKIQS